MTVDIRIRDLMIFRIVQELLNYAIKHSEAKLITVNLIVATSPMVTAEDIVRIVHHPARLLILHLHSSPQR